MIIGVIKESGNDTRVSLMPDAVATLTKKGITVWVENDAGKKAFAYDADYEKRGAVIKTFDEILNSADILLFINPTSTIGFTSDHAKKVLIGVYFPLFNKELIKDWAGKGLTCFSLDMLPRTSRAQSMDVLSSQANIAGYKAVIEAASIFPRYFPMLMTAAGSIAPAKVVILGAGVAGLQAIATARRLGAQVEVFDTRPAVKEEVMSLGAKFIEVEGAAHSAQAGGYAVQQTEEYLKKQQERIAESITKADIVITTAQIPGKKAPILITGEMINEMKKGSVIVDIAAASGGNTPFTKNNERVVVNDVSIIGDGNLPAGMPSDASRMYGKNILNFLQLLITKEGTLNLNWDDDLVKGSCITFEGKIVNERVKSSL